MSQNANSKVIMVHSYKGGAGKTAISINLSNYLAVKKKKKILLIEQDVCGPSFVSVFKIQPNRFWNDFYSKDLPLEDLVMKLDSFDVICAKVQATSLLSGENLNEFYGKQLERLKWQKRSLRKQYDYIVLDTHPGYNMELINNVIISDVAVLISRLDADTVRHTIDMYERVYSQFRDKRIILAQNQIPEPVSSQNQPKIDLDVEKTLKSWEQFSVDKNIVNIPLRNDIAYALSRSKLLKTSNPFYEYIKQIAELLG